MRTREQIEKDVRADFKKLDRKQRFSGAQADVAHWNWQFQENPWTRDTILDARVNPSFQEVFGPELVGANFGRGRARPPWVVMARVFAGLLLRHANPPQKGLGSDTGPLLRLVRAQLVRLLGEDSVPLPGDMRRSLNRVASETKGRLRGVNEKRHTRG
jgi:hypothetical protein